MATATSRDPSLIERRVLSNEKSVSLNFVPGSCEGTPYEEKAYYIMVVMDRRHDVAFNVSGPEEYARGKFETMLAILDS